MPKKFHWDLIRVLVLIGAMLGIIFGILMLLNILKPFWNFFAPEWISTIIIVIICCITILGYGILGWDMDSRKSFFFLICFGIILIVIFSNLAGIIFVVAAILVIFSA